MRVRSVSPIPASLDANNAPLSPPHPLMKRTSSRNFRDGAALGSSLPTTPRPARRRPRKGNDALRGNVSRNERPIADVSPGAFKQRHSHDLSWSSTTRDAVVDGLLNSLDAFALGNIGIVDETQEDNDHAKHSGMQAQYPMSRTAQRARGHTHSSSLSSGSDRDGVGASPSSLHADQVPGRARSSNSSSNVGTVSGPNSKVRPGPRTIARTGSETQRPIHSGRHDVRDTVMHESKSSGRSSFDFDYGAVVEASRLAWGGRSASMDHLHLDNPKPIPEGSLSSFVLERGRLVPSVHSRYETEQAAQAAQAACPDPMIPAGPRKRENPTAQGPVFVNPAPAKHSALRKTMTQSDLRSANQQQIALEIRNQASDFVRLNSMRAWPPLPGSAGDEGAPSPGVGARPIDVVPPPRERPGFFKRVFGSSKTNSSLSTESRTTFMDSIDHSERASQQEIMPTSTTVTSHSRPDTNMVLKELPKGTSYPQPPLVNKKSSSFFRRRKKASSEIEKVPELALNMMNNLAITEVPFAQPSPSISSLRKVMDPYLSHEGSPAPPSQLGKEIHSHSRPTTRDTTADEEDDENLDMFHSGYTPPPDASLRRANPLSRESSMSISRDLETVRGLHPQTSESPKMRMKLKKRRPDESLPNLYITKTSELKVISHDVPRAAISPLPTELTFGSWSEPSYAPKVSPLSEVPLNLPLEEPPLSRVSTGERIIASNGASPVEASQEMRDFSGATGMSLYMGEDETWIVAAPSKPSAQERPDSNKSQRVFLHPTLSEEKLADVADGSLSPSPSPIEGSRFTSRSDSLRDRYPRNISDSYSAHSPDQPSTQWYSATSLPMVQVDGDTVRPSMEAPAASSPPQKVIDESIEHRERARKIYQGDEEDVSKAEAAAWLGENSALSTHTLIAYMQLFDFAGQNALSALRTLCNKLVLRGETQQVDRIIDGLSQRWCDCNPNHGFKAKDVVHTIYYSLVMLNTDLHMADIVEKMTRNQYVKNTLPSIKRVVEDAAPGAFDDTVKPGNAQSRPSLPRQDSTPSVPTSPMFPPPDAPDDRPSFEMKRQNKRLSIRPGTFRNDSDGWTPDSATTAASNALVNSPWDGPMRGWEFEVETVLKSFYSSIRAEPLPLHGSGPAELVSPNYLSVSHFGGLKRSGSVVSRAPSDNMSYRSRPDFRSMTSRWQSKTSRSWSKIYPSSTIDSSRTSLDDVNSMWSPAQSSMWSKYSLGKTQTSMSVASLGSHTMPSDYKQSIGFANALSQAIIREEADSVDSSSLKHVGGLLEYETLELAGAPWAKEGILKHKHHLESPDKKAKERSWNECFAVIEKGRLTLFSFDSSGKSKSMGRNRNHATQNKSGNAASVAASVVGGGNWQENAEQLESFLLRQTIASTMPSPGYSKARPHVWTLSLPNGALHLFQVGTPDIAREFMSTANYWSARLSKEPLVGGVSNIEYGWSDAVINSALVGLDNPPARTDSVPSLPPSSLTYQHNQGRGLHSARDSMSVPRSSLQNNLRGSLDQGFGSSRVRLPGDKVQVAEWTAPVQSMMPSQLMEVDQLRALTAYVGNVEEDLGRHNELRHAVELAFSPRHSNYTRATNNWQRKSEYLLRENVKFRTYIDSLAAAQNAREQISAERAAHEAAKSGLNMDTARNGLDSRDITPRALSSQHPLPSMPANGKEDRDITPRAVQSQRGMD